MLRLAWAGQVNAVTASTTSPVATRFSSAMIMETSSSSSSSVAVLVHRFWDPHGGCVDVDVGVGDGVGVGVGVGDDIVLLFYFYNVDMTFSS